MSIDSPEERGSQVNDTRTVITRLRCGCDITHGSVGTVYDITYCPLHADAERLRRRVEALEAAMNPADVARVDAELEGRK